MKYNRTSRRLFLQGSGHALLALPILTSLLPRNARAQAAQIAPRYYGLFLPFGPVQDNWHPSATGMIKTQILPAYSTLPAYEIASKSLVASASGVSYLFDQKFNAFLSKMNFLKGLDTRISGHHYGGAVLGNIWAIRPGEYPEFRSMPTIDHIMAHAPNFYPNGGTGFVPQIVAGINYDMNYGEGFSYGFSNPKARSGPVVHMDSIYQHNPKTLFDAVFAGFQPTPVTTSSTPIIDSVLSDFKKIRDGRAISSEDKLALQTHVDLLAQLEQSLSTTTTLSCTLPNAPASLPGTQPYQGPTNAKLQVQLINDVIFAAFRCQLTRVASFNLHVQHYDKLHIHEADANFSSLKGNQKWNTDNAIFDIVQKLDSFVEANGKTMLDNSIVHCTGASGPYSHAQYSHPCLLFGSGNGQIKTGQFIDYRMQNAAANKNLGDTSTGLLQNQLWVTIMQAMGLSPADYNMANLGLLRSVYSASTDTYGEFMPSSADIYEAKDNFRYFLPQTIAGKKLPLL